MTTKMKIPTEEQVLAFLNSLGDTSDAIAKSLEGRHVKAICQDPHKCAIAQALTDEFGGNAQYRWTVGSDIDLTEYTLVGWAPSREHPRRRKYRGDVLHVSYQVVPKAIDDFISAYDNHKYPQLETKASLKAPREDDDDD